MKKLAAVLGVLTTLALIASVLNTTPQRSADVTVPKAETEPVTRTFRFDYRASTAVELRGVKDTETFRGELDLAGDIRVSALPRAADEPRRIAIRLGPLNRHSFSFLGRKVLDASSDAAAFFGDVTLVVHLDDDGFVSAVEEPEVPHAAQHVLEVLATDMPLGLSLIHI